MIARLGPSRSIVADEHPLFRAVFGRVELGGLVQQPSGQVASCPLAVLSKHLLGETGWLKALQLAEYASREPQRPQALQQALFLMPALDCDA